MSPSLTSGFSGSGDCKSTETCSLLSVASYSSATPTGPQLAKERQAEAGGGAGAAGGGGGASAASTPPRHMVNCEVGLSSIYRAVTKFRDIFTLFG